jgi:hypothetical protein
LSTRRHQIEVEAPVIDSGMFHVALPDQKET